MKVVYFEPELPSYTWAKGLYVIVDTVDSTYHMCRLTRSGELTTNYGEPEITVTGIGNKGIHETNLIYTK